MRPSLASTESPLSRALWASADARRGELADPLVGALPQLAALLLLRWIDLVDAEREAIALFNDEDYERALTAELTWDTWAHLRGPALAHHIQEVLLPGLAAVRLGAFPVDLTHPAIAEVLGRATPFDELVQAVASLPFETAAEQRRTGSLFGELVRATIAKARHAGTYATPLGVARLMAHLAAPRPGDRIFDPCFGSAELLVQCIDRLHAAEDFHTGVQWERVQAESVFGVEISAALHLIGLVRVLLAGIEQPGLVLGDALQRPVENGHAQRFDVVVAVPPWGKRARAALGSQEAFPFKTNSLEATFLQLAMASLRPGGRTVIAMPDAFLFRGGGEQAMRRWLLEEHQVEAVIQLPSESFKPYTGVRISLLVLAKGGRTQQVRFVDLNVLGDTLDLDLDRDFDQILAWTRGDWRDEESGAVRILTAAQLAEREWNFIAPSAAEDEFRTVIEELDQQEAVNTVSLKEVASIRHGLSYTRAQATEDARDPMAARGLIRVRDVGERRVRPPSLYAHPELAARAKEGQVLRAGDLVVTSSGSIGRVGMVTNGSVSCIATNGVLVVRPSKGVSARYLAGLLRSPLSQELLASLARGMSVQRLPVAALKALRVPIPPLPIQERVADAAEHRGGDALALLRMMLTEDTHPVATFLETDASAHALWHLRNVMANAKVSGSEGEPLVALRLFGKGLQQAIAEGGEAPGLRFGDEVARWVRSLQSAATGLATVATEAAEPELVPVQLSAQGAVSSALKGVVASIPDDLRAHQRGLERTLNAAYFLVEHESRALVRDVGIEAYQVASNKSQLSLFSEPDPGRSVVLAVLNTGQAPLLQFVGELQVTGGERFRKLSSDLLLGEQQERHAVSVPDTVEDTFRATLRWQANTSWLEPVSGEVEVELVVEAPDDERAEQEPEAMGSSPYILGNPVDRAEMFFGREDILDKMRLHLSREGVANVILLEGNRRTGKTSILKSLQRPVTLPSHVPIYCSFQASAGHDTKLGVSTDEVFKTIGRSLVKDCTLAGYSLPIIGTPKDFGERGEQKRKGFIHMRLPQLVNAWFRDRNAFSALDSLVQVAIDAVAPRRLLLMLDEFDKLQEGIDSGVTSPQVPENIRYLFQNNTAMAGVLTGSRRIRRLREEYWNALFGFGFAICVTALPRDGAAALIQKPVAGRLTYQPGAVEDILTLCACQPFLIQLLCARVFDHAAADQARHVSKKLVDSAVEDLVRDNEHFRTLWGYAGSERARYILRLCHDLQEGPDPVTFDLLQNKLDHSEVFMDADSLRDDIDHLRELELVSQEPDGHYHVYRLAVPLMGLWIERNIDGRELLELAVQEARQER